jgi:hypothetical protein
MKDWRLPLQAFVAFFLFSRHLSDFSFHLVWNNNLDSNLTDKNGAACTFVRSEDNQTKLLKVARRLARGNDDLAHEQVRDDDGDLEEYSSFVFDFGGVVWRY